MKNLAEINAKGIRDLIRKGKITNSTAGMAKGYAQANLVILKKRICI